MSGAINWRGHLAAELTRVKPRSVPWQVALRNTFGVVLPLVIGQMTGYAEIGLGISVGALMVVFADQPGPYRRRLRNILLTSAAGALATLMGLGVGDALLPLLLVAAVWTFVASLLVALGPDLTRAGLISTLLLVISASGAHHQGVPPLAAMGLVLAGGLLQAVLSILAWPLNRYRPERFALSSAFIALATAARQPPASSDAPPASNEIDEVQAMLLDDGRLQSRALESLRILVALFERMRMELVALAEYQHGATDDADIETLHQLHRAAAHVLLAIAATLRDTRNDESEVAGLLARWDEALAALERTASDSGTSSMLAAAQRAKALGKQMRAALRNVGYASSAGEIRAHDAERRLPAALRQGQPLAILWANLDLHSIACRHALRSTACVTLALAASRLLPVEHAYWMPMTAAIVLKPDFAATVNYGLLRVAGTLAGLLVTSLLLHYVLDATWARIALLALLCWGFRQLTPMHYGIGVAALSGLVVIMSTLGGEAPGPVMLARAVGTVAGSALALAAYGFWPTWERGRVRASLADMLDSYAAYLGSLGSDLARRRDTRSAGRVARSNARASLERLRQEPRSGEGLLALGDAVFATGSRLARVSMALDAALDGIDAGAPERDDIERLRDLAAQRAAELATCLRHASAPGPVAPELHQSVAVLHADIDGHDPQGLADIADRIEDILATLAFLLTPKASP